MEKEYVTILEASKRSGLAQCYIRKRCRESSIPMIKVGRIYRINYPQMMEQIRNETLANVEKQK